MPTSEITLDQAPIGQPVRVVSVTGDDAIARRLADLGMRPGMTVECLRRAPLGDPSVFELCGYQLCLRSSESARVRVVWIARDARGEAGSRTEGSPATRRTARP
jgi:ferrous iron transport protein A